MKQKTRSPAAKPVLVLPEDIEDEVFQEAIRAGYFPIKGRPHHVRVLSPLAADDLPASDLLMSALNALSGGNTTSDDIRRREFIGELNARLRAREAPPSV